MTNQLSSEELAIVEKHLTPFLDAEVINNLKNYDQPGIIKLISDLKSERENQYDLFQELFDEIGGERGFELNMKVVDKLNWDLDYEYFSKRFNMPSISELCDNYYDDKYSGFIDSCGKYIAHELEIFISGYYSEYEIMLNALYLFERIGEEGKYYIKNILKTDIWEMDFTFAERDYNSFFRFIHKHQGNEGMIYFLEYYSIGQLFYEKSDYPYLSDFLLQAMLEGLESDKKKFKEGAKKVFEEFAHFFTELHLDQIEKYHQGKIDEITCIKEILKNL